MSPPTAIDPLPDALTVFPGGTAAVASRVANECPHNAASAATATQQPAATGQRMSAELIACGRTSALETHVAAANATIVTAVARHHLTNRTTIPPPNSVTACAMFSERARAPNSSAIDSRSVRRGSGKPRPRRRSNHGRAILRSSRQTASHILTWSLGWSYGDSNPRPLACHIRSPGRSIPLYVARHGADLQ
jgi:hypothetical protein